MTRRCYRAEFGEEFSTEAISGVVWNPVRAIRRCVTLVVHVLKSSEFEEYSEICAIRIWTETLISEFGEDLDSGEISRLHLR